MWVVLAAETWWAPPYLLGLIEYSGGTLCVLMLCLRGLFNSANRHKKAVSATLLRLHFTPGIHSDGGSAPSADLCELTLAVSPGSCPTGEWTLHLRMHPARRSCQFMLMRCWISHEKQLIFWAGWSWVFTRSLITMFCGGALADCVPCEVRHAQNLKNVHSRLRNSLLPVYYTVHTLDLLRCQENPLWFITVRIRDTVITKFLIPAYTSSKIKGFPCTRYKFAFTLWMSCFNKNGIIFRKPDQCCQVPTRGGYRFGARGAQPQLISDWPLTCK